MMCCKKPDLKCWSGVFLNSLTRAASISIQHTGNIHDFLNSAPIELRIQAPVYIDHVGRDIGRFGRHQEPDRMCYFFGQTKPFYRDHRF